MANSKTGTSLSAVLPLPPLEYDTQYMNNLVRILNFFIQQLQSQGLVQGNQLIIQDRDQSTRLNIDTQLVPDTLTIITTNLPTSSVGLVSGQIWNDAGTLKVIP